MKPSLSIQLYKKWYIKIERWSEMGASLKAKKPPPFQDFDANDVSWMIRTSQGGFHKQNIGFSLFCKDFHLYQDLV